MGSTDARLVARLLTLVGALAMLIGIATMAYAHFSVARDLQRTVDVARRALDDSITAVGTLAWLARSTDAVRGPTEDVTRRSIAALEPSVAILQALADMLRVVPGAGGAAADDAPTTGLATSLTRLRRTVAQLTVNARRIRAASRTLATRMERHEIPSMQPDLARATARLHEMRDIIHEANPARGITLLVDLIAGLYTILGGALIVVGRAVHRGAARSESTPPTGS